MANFGDIEFTPISCTSCTHLNPPFAAPLPGHGSVIVCLWPGDDVESEGTGQADDDFSKDSGLHWGRPGVCRGKHHADT